MIDWSTLSLTFKDNCSYWIRVSKFLFGDPRCGLHNNPQHFSGKKKIQVYSETGVIFRRENESPRAEQAQMCRRGVDTTGQPPSWVTHEAHQPACRRRLSLVGSKEEVGFMRSVFKTCKICLIVITQFCLTTHIVNYIWFRQKQSDSGLFFSSIVETPGGKNKYCILPELLKVWNRYMRFPMSTLAVVNLGFDRI